MPFNAIETGTHTVEIYYAGRREDYEVLLSVGEVVKFDNWFNESGFSSFKIKQPSGEYFEFSVGNATYDCFNVKNIIKMSYTSNSAQTQQSVTYAGVPVVETSTGANSFVIPAHATGTIDLNSIQVHANGAFQALGASAYGFTASLAGDGSITVTTTENWGSVDDPCVITINYLLREEI